MARDDDWDAKVHQRTLVTLWVFTTLCVAIEYFTARLALYVFAVAGFHLPANAGQIPAWLVVIGFVTSPIVLVAAVIGAWTFFAREKYRAARILMLVAVLWLVPGALMWWMWWKDS